MKYNTSYDCWKALYLKAYPDASESDVKHTSFDIIIELIKALDETVNTQIITSEYSALHELCYLLSGDATIRSSRYDYLLNLLKYYDADAKASTEYDCLVKLVDYIEFTVTSGLAITNIASNARTLYLQSAPSVGRISYSTDKCKTWTSIASGESVSLSVQSGDTVYAKNYYSGDIDSISSSSQVSNYQIHASGSNASFEVKGDLSEWIYTDSNFDSKQVVKHAFSLLVGGPIVWEVKQWVRPTSNYEYEYFYYPTTAEETKHTITLDNSFDGCFSDNQHFRHMFARCSNCHIDLSKVDMSGWNPLTTFGWMHVGGETTVYLSQSQYDEFTNNIVLGTTSTFTTDTVMFVNNVKKFDVLQNTAINFDNADKLTDFSASENFLTYWHLQVTNDFGMTWRDVETETSQDMLDYVHGADVVYMRGFLKQAVSSSSTITSGMNIQYTSGTTATVGGYLTSLMYNADFNDLQDRWADAQNNVSNYMFSYIFSGCGFAVADIFHAYNLPKTANALLQYAFANCANLTEVKGTCIRNNNDTIITALYYYTFTNCQNLVTVPNNYFEGIVTSAVNGCVGTFANCTSLTSAPNLPATTLGTYAYRYMFQGCSALVNIQSVLPALSVPSNAYNGMYQDCTSLVEAPQLLATELASNSCANMFRGCSSLVVPPVLPATKMAGSCYQSMFQNCTSLVEAPQLPATELASNCYNSMFSGCSNLEKAPVLPATELASNCYTSLFRACLKLTKVVTYQIETPSTTYNNTWLYTIRTEGTIYAPNGANWGEITSTSVKPATWNVVVGTGE